MPAAYDAVRAILGGVAIASAAAVAAAPPASADPVPNCTAGDLAQIATGVSAATSVYLFSHPDVNAFLTNLERAPRDTVRAQVDDYMAANPRVQADLEGIRQPLLDMRNRCGFSGDEES
ncbi:MAG TPA: heme-binding protein [Mycobacterium sp.]|nr:heme-binding protein [Mycobacterium sp.]